MTNVHDRVLTVSRELMAKEAGVVDAFTRGVIGAFGRRSTAGKWAIKQRGLTRKIVDPVTRERIGFRGIVDKSPVAQTAGAIRDIARGTVMRPKTQTGRALKTGIVGLGLVGTAGAGVGAYRAATQPTGYGHAPPSVVPPGY